MSSPGSWEFTPDWEITPDPFDETRAPLPDALFGTWNADTLELIGEEYGITEKEHHAGGVEDGKGEQEKGSQDQEHEVEKETNEQLAVMMPYYPSGQPRVRRTARMRTPQLKRYSFSLSPPPAKRVKTTSGKTPTRVRSTHERGETSYAPEGTDGMADNRVISTNTLMEEMKKEIDHLKGRVQMVEGDNSENRRDLQQIRNDMGVAYNNVGSYMVAANQRREQLEVVTGVVAQQVMITNARSVVNEYRVGACEQDNNGMRWEIDNLTYLFGSRFGFP